MVCGCVQVEQRDRLMLRGIGLEGALFPPLCAECREELRDSNLVVESCGAKNVWSRFGDSGLHYRAESQGRMPLCREARRLIRSWLHYDCLVFPKGVL